MKTTQSSGTRPDHQTVAGTLEFKSNGKSIAIGFTDQELSPHAGSALFWGWLKPLDWCKKLAAALPHALPRSNNKLLPLEKALAFMHGLLCDARKLTHVSYLRRDPLVPELLGITRVASQSVLTRFFQGFTSAGDNLRCFRPLWHWGMDRLPSQKEGYTLDLDSTRLLHKDGQQEGVKGGYTKQGIKPCLHPLLAVLAEVRLVAQLWLRPGNASCGSNSAAFFLDLWKNLPRHIRLKGVRADSGFCLPELLDLWERLKLPYVVVAQLSQPIQKIIKGDLKWTATEVPGTEVAELEYQAMSWPHPRRLVLLRHRVSDDEERGGTEPGVPDLQPDRAVPAAPGLAAESDPAEPEVLAVCDGGSAESSGGQDDAQTGRARAGTRLVAALMGEDSEPDPQLQCSRKSPRIHLPIRMKN